MSRIYLASESPARKKLLREFGLKFQVVPSRVQEIIRRGTASYSDLVKRNALLKARDVARRVKSGIIIGADTLVVQKGKIFGKPKDLPDARRMLKKLSRGRQWLYTGVAVIDKDTGRVKVACEKTAVIMDCLSDKEIRAYYSRVSPLTMAGGFDIQGKGAFFIKRIEGCFYNVVGLPMRTLYRMLKELGVKVFMFLFFFAPLAAIIILSGCTTEYNIVTGREESYFYSTDSEVQMGRNIARQIEDEEEFVDDPLVQKRVEDIGAKIAAVCDRRDIVYNFKVLKDDEVNAVSLPGGFVYINSGLVEKAASDDELAAVIAHEVGHIVARHSIKKLQGLQGYSIFRALLIAAPARGEVGTAADAAVTQLLLGYSREDELLADQLGARYARAAGYDPRGMITFLETLQEVNKRKPLAPRSYFKTHPYVPDRIRTVKQELGEKMDFSDYVNIEQAPR